MSVCVYSSHEQCWTWQPRDWNPLFNHRLGIVKQKDIFLYTAPVACLSPELESRSSISEKKHSGQSVLGLISAAVKKKHSCHWVSWQVVMSSLEQTESSLSLIWEFLSVSYWENVVFCPSWKLYICVHYVVTYLFKGIRFSGQFTFSHGLDLKLIYVYDFFTFLLFLLGWTFKIPSLKLSKIINLTPVFEMLKCFIWQQSKTKALQRLLQ